MTFIFLHRSAAQLYVNALSLSNDDACKNRTHENTLIDYHAVADSILFQGNITKWKKKEGDQVSPGQVLAEVETDKATMEWEAQEDGYIAKLLLSDGAKDIAVGTPVVVIVEELESVAAFKSYTIGGARAQSFDR